LRVVAVVVETTVAAVALVGILKQLANYYMLELFIP